MEQELSSEAARLGIKITFAQEKEPLGTAGPLALSKDILASNNEPFFVLNSDVICNFPFTEMVKFHKSHGKEGTIAVSIKSSLDQCTVVRGGDKTYQVILSDLCGFGLFDCLLMYNSIRKYF